MGVASIFSLKGPKQLGVLRSNGPSIRRLSWEHEIFHYSARLLRRCAKSIGTLVSLTDICRVSWLVDAGMLSIIVQLTGSFSVDQSDRVCCFSWS